MAASKDRLRWTGLSAPVRAAIERLVGGVVVAAVNCPGGYSPGFASRLTLDDGRRVFVKATDAESQREVYRAEVRAASALRPGGPWPRLRGTFDDGHWVVLAFEDIDGHEPTVPWRSIDLERVLATLRGVADLPPPVGLPIHIGASLVITVAQWTRPTWPRAGPVCHGDLRA